MNVRRKKCKEKTKTVVVFQTRALFVRLMRNCFFFVVVVLSS